MKTNTRQAFFMGGLTFFLTLGMGTISNSLVQGAGLGLTFLWLFSMVLLGIVFDIIGVAATAAQEKPFNAMGAKRIPGARHALRLVREADKVSAFSSDVIGDISGTISGALTMAIVIRLLTIYPYLNETATSAILTAFIAAMSVGGKASGKAFAIERSTYILHLVGRILESMEKITRFGRAKGRRGAP